MEYDREDKGHTQERKNKHPPRARHFKLSSFDMIYNKARQDRFLVKRVSSLCIRCDSF